MRKNVELMIVVIITSILNNAKDFYTKSFHTYSYMKYLHFFSSEDLALTPGHSQKVFAVKFHSEDRNVFISASWDHSVKV